MFCFFVALVLLEWSDTLLPLTLLASASSNEKTTIIIKRQLQLLDLAVVRMLERWIECTLFACYICVDHQSDSATLVRQLKSCLPLTHLLLAKNRIGLAFGLTIQDALTTWLGTLGRPVTHIIAAGVRLAPLCAATMKQGDTQTCLKTVAFAPRPTCLQLLRQVELLHASIATLVTLSCSANAELLCTTKSAAKSSSNTAALK